MTDTYSPFSERDLEQLAAWHEKGAAMLREESNIAAFHVRAAAILRDAIAGHVALRERCFRAEHELRYGINHNAIAEDSEHATH